MHAREASRIRQILSQRSPASFREGVEGWSIIFAVTRWNRSSLRRLRLFRTPAVAGQFYPSDPGELDRILADLIPSAPSRSPEPAVAVLVPHAGYVYSGRIAGAVYGRVRVPPRILLMGP